MTEKGAKHAISYVSFTVRPNGSGDLDVTVFRDWGRVGADARFGQRRPGPGRHLRRRADPTRVL